jgi:PadR family transcriptional regulator, regulatory protein AphA
MSIKYAILGMLSIEPLTGYDLKKKFTGSLTLYWSGNSNQIYKTLVELHQENSVTLEIQVQTDKPPRKIYTITDAGRAELRRWMMSTPEVPQLRHLLLIQLTWADELSAAELDDLLNRCEDELNIHLMMLRETLRRNSTPARTPREALLLTSISDHWVAFYENEIHWLRDLRQKLSDLKE